MEAHIEPIWKPCSKEEYEKACAKHPYTWFFDYLRKPIYDGPTPQGLLAQIEPEKRKIIGYNYFKKAGEKLVLVCSDWSLSALWDMADFRALVCKPELNSEELIEALVKIIEETWIGEHQKTY